MEFLVRAAGAPRQVGVFPGTYNPPTCAHFALARAALEAVDEVAFVIPRAFPHKEYVGATFEQRLEMLSRIVSGERRFSVAASEGGLFIEIARECREAYDSRPSLIFLCGRDAAERIVNWDYGHPEAVPRMLDEFQLMVAARQGAYAAPAEIAHAVRVLPIEGDFGDISATELRRRISKHEPWKHLAPESIHDRIERIYS